MHHSLHFYSFSSNWQFFSNDSLNHCKSTNVCNKNANMKNLCVIYLDLAYQFMSSWRVLQFLVGASGPEVVGLNHKALNRFLNYSTVVSYLNSPSHT